MGKDTKNPEGKKKRMGRPKKTINWRVVKERIEAGNSANSIASAHQIDRMTFYKRFQEEFGMTFTEYSCIGKENGKANIAHTQYIKALQGNCQMLTLLGQEWLGQGRGEIEKKSPTQEMRAVEHENMILRSLIRKLDKDGIFNTYIGKIDDACPPPEQKPNFDYEPQTGPEL